MPEITSRLSDLNTECLSISVITDVFVDAVTEDYLANIVVPISGKLWKMVAVPVSEILELYKSSKNIEAHTNFIVGLGRLLQEPPNR